MRRRFKKKKRTILIVTTAIIVCLMSIGLAATAYTETLNMSGNVTVKAVKWNVHFNQTSYRETSGSANINDTLVVNSNLWGFQVTLANQGDFYEATMNIVNDGDFNAILSSITIDGFNDYEDFDYVSYSITYDRTNIIINNYDTIINLNGADINDFGSYDPINASSFRSPNTLIAKTGVHQVKVRLEYISSESKPVTFNITNSFSFTKTNNYVSTN